VQGIGAGIDMYYGARLPADVVLTNAAGISAVPMAEFVMARILSVWKRFPELAALQERHEWKPAYGALFAGSTLGIVGFGAIGAAIAERARAFGARVVASRRRPELGDGGTGLVDVMYGPDELHELLAQCDSVVVAAPATPETRDLFDAAAFAAMKPGSVFCNVGRGSLVDEDALIDAARAGHLRAAILDVTRYEPLPPESPLWDAPNVLLSPHSSATADRYAERLYELFADNLRRYLAGEPLRNVVDQALVLG
jgi:phosphoglycerate dehydrogenase-like enzyme